MAQGYNSEQTHFMVGDESTFGTEVATTTKVGTVRNNNPTYAWNVFEVQGAGDGREVQNYVRTQFRVNDSMVVELHDFSVLKYAVGPLTGSGTIGAPYVITEADSTGTTAATDIIPFSLEVASESSTDDVDTMAGCVIDEFSLQFDLEAPVVATLTIIAQKVTSSTTGTSYTPATTTPLMMTSGVFKWGATPTARSEIRSATISYRNNMRVFGQWNSVYIAHPEAGKRNITWSATLIMAQAVATTLRDDFYGQANSPVTDAGSLVYAATNELHVVFDEGSSTGDRDATVQLDHCIVDSVSKPIDIGSDDLVLVTFSGRAATSKSNIFVTWYTNA